MSFAKTIVESDEVTEQLDELRQNFDRFDDIWTMLSWKLARDPESPTSYLIPNTNPDKYITKVADNDVEGVPSVTVLYSFDQDNLYIEAMRVE